MVLNPEDGYKCKNYLSNKFKFSFSADFYAIFPEYTVSVLKKFKNLLRKLFFGRKSQENF